MSYLEKLNSIIGDLIAPQAAQNDQQAKFPRESIKALGEAGILGLMSTKELGGLGLGLSEASEVIEKLATSCPSTAMILTMHYSATAVIEKFGTESVRKEIAQGRHLTTLAWSEAGSRSHFWAPTGTATKDKTGNTISITSQKTMVTSAFEADSYVWTSKPVAVAGASSMWLVEKTNPAVTPKVQTDKKFDGLGLRANASAPMECINMKVSEAAMLGADGAAFDTMIGVVLPIFCTLSAASSIGIMEASLNATIKHVTEAKYEHLGQSLAELPTIRAYLAKAQTKKDMIKTLRKDTTEALQSGRADAMLRVMEVKAAAAEAALETTDICMRVAAGASYRKDLGIERFFRDARASHIMAPTSDVLFDFIGKAICGMPVFG